jgi:hypothetical protein
MTMEPAMLKDIVLPPTLMRKLLNVAGVSGLVEHAKFSFARDPETDGQNTKSCVGPVHCADSVEKTRCEAYEQ